MPTLIACLSSGKGTWTEVIKIIQSRQWDKIFLITNQFGKENFTLKQANLTLILTNSFQEVEKIKEDIMRELKVTDFEVALNFISGTGKEHMALMEAILELGLNFRLITTNNGEVDTLGIKPNS